MNVKQLPFAAALALSTLALAPSAASVRGEGEGQPSPELAMPVSQPPPLLPGEGPPAGAASQPDPVHELYDRSVVRDIKITLDEPGEWLSRLGCRRTPGPGAPPDTDEDASATLEVDGVRLERIGVRCKGNSSLGISNTKKPLNITTDSFVKGQTLWGFDVINLNNNWSDASQLREALSLHAMGDFMPSPRFSFARVSMQGEYLGLYLMVEQVNGEFAEHWYPFEDDGVIIKGDSPVQIAFNTSGLTWRGESLDVYRQYYEVKGKARESDVGYELLRELIRALDAPIGAGGLSDSEFASGISAVFDVDAALWYIVGNNLLANYDSYYVGKNYYLYRGERDEHFRMIPWDLGLGFGLFGLRNSTQPGGGPGTGGNPATVDPFAQIDDPGRPVIRRLLAVPEFRADYLAHYRALMAAAGSRSWVEGLGREYQDLIRDAVSDEEAEQGSVAGSFTFAQFESNLIEPIVLPGGGGRGPRSVPGLATFMEERFAHLSGLPELAAPDVALLGKAANPAAPTSAEPVTVSVTFAGADQPTSAELRFRVNAGPEQRVTMIAGGEKQWSAVIPSQRTGAVVSYAIRVGLANGFAEFFPAANQTRPFTYEVQGANLPHVEGSSIVINEFMADNQTVLADTAGEFDDWIELYNRGTQAVNLSGMYLSDDPQDPWKFELPDVDVAPGAYVLIWADNDPEQGAHHAPFRLNLDGEFVVVATSDAILDEIEFGPQLSDVSYARRTDGSADWIHCASPSPGAQNDCLAVPPPTARPSPSPQPTATPSAGPNRIKIHIPLALTTR